MSDEKTTTERLRALLDDRGVRYETYHDVALTEVDAVFWQDRNGQPCSAIGNADDIPERMLSVQCIITPEQAVEATLGSGTCKMDTFADVKFQDMDEDEEGCYEIGALAECSECGSIVLMPPEYAHFDRESLFAATNFCPNCGREVGE